MRPARPARARVGAIALVLGEGHLFLARLPGGLVLDDLLGLQRHDLGGEAPGLLAGGGALLAGERVLVLHLAGDVVALGHDLRGLDHRHVDFRLVLVEPRLVDAEVVEVLVLHEADRLDAARGHDRHPVHDHALGGHGDGLHPRGAEAVHGDAAGGHGQPGAQRRLARDVLAGRALRAGRSR